MIGFLKKNNKEEEKEYIVIERAKENIEGSVYYNEKNKRYVIIPKKNVKYIYNADVYNEDINKYQNRITILLLDDTKHKIYEGDKVYFATQNQVEGIVII